MRFLNSSCSFCAALLLLFAVDAGSAPDSGDAHLDREIEASRPKIGLVLGGGGARGLAHIGVLQVLEEHRVPVDYITGTSMGALVGGLYAAGLSVDEIEDVVKGIDWDAAFQDSAPREEKSYRRKTDDNLAMIQGRIGVSGEGLQLAPGVVKGQQILLLLERFTEPVAEVRDFDELPIPFRAVAADINTGQPVVLGEGELAMAMRASMSLPGIFAPVAVDDLILVDGGIANNLPVDIARAMGADVVIAVDVSTALNELTDRASLLSVIEQLSTIMVQNTTLAQRATLSPDDILIVPELGTEVRSSDFSKAAEAYEFGLAAMEEHRNRLDTLSLPEDDWELHLARRAARDTVEPVIRFVRLNNQSHYRDDVLETRIEISTGGPLDLEQVEESIARINRLDVFEQVNWELVEENGDMGVMINAIEDRRGPNYLELGLTISGDFDGDNYLNFRGALHGVPANGLGGEWRVIAQFGQDAGIWGEWFQPLDTGLRWFVRPFVGYQRRLFNVFDDAGERVAEVRVSDTRAQLGAGRQLGNWGVFSLGVRGYSGKSETRIGIPQASNNFDGGEWFARFGVDTLNNLFFPGQGQYLQFEYIWSREDLGADTEFEQFLLDGLVSGTWGRNTFLGGLRAYSTVDGVAPVQNFFRAGGFTRLSGFNFNELTGQEFRMLYGGYLRRFGILLKMDAYLGGTLEYGNVWRDRDDVSFSSALFAGSVFLGLDSPLGPAYLGLGLAEGDNQTLFLYFGQLP